MRKPWKIQTEEERERTRAASRAYARRNPLVESLRKDAWRKREGEDPKRYAERRRKDREYYERKRRESGKPYHATPSLRIPDYCTKGNALNRDSPFIWNNRGKSAMMAILDYSYEQKEATK